MRNLILLMPLLAAACSTQTSLKSNTTKAAASVMEIEYQIIMDNLAHMVSSPAALPSQIRIKQGTVQVSDEWGLYSLEASGVASGSFGGVRAERTVSEQWGADAITDPRTLKLVQDLYRTALRLPPLPNPSFMAMQQSSATVQKSAAAHEETETSNTSGKDHSKSNTPSPTTMMEMQRDVPHDWFHVGTKNQVPSDALYVSHSGPTWVWTTPADIDGLSRFTLLVLFVTKLGPGESDSSSGGLMFTGGGK